MYKLSIFSFLLGIVTLWGCKEPDITPENNKDFPIAINVKANPSGGVEIYWDKVNINKFDNYTLIRSVDSLNFSPQFGDTLWVVDDINQTKIIDKNLPLLNKVYYTLSVNIKGRVLQSKSEPFQRTDILSFDNVIYDSRLVNPTKGIIYLINSNNRTMRTINIETGVLSKEVNMPSLGIKTLTLRAEDPDNLYFVAEDKIEIYDATTLELRQTLKNSNYPTDRFVSIISGYGKYYVTIYGYPLKVKVFDATSKALLKTYSTTYNIDSRMVIRIFPNQKRLLSYYENGGQDDEAILIDLDDNGNIMSSNKVVDVSYPFNSYNCVIAPNGESVIFNKKIIMDKNLKELSPFPGFGSNSGTFPHYSPNSLYVLSDDGFSSSSIIDMKNYQVLRTIPFKNTNSGFISSSPLFLTNTEYVSFGEQFLSSFNKRIIILKTKFL
jgi:hypothetical protein